MILSPHVWQVGRSRTIIGLWFTVTTKMFLLYSKVVGTTSSEGFLVMAVISTDKI